jgi:NADH:ubiquinone oxidoreductase subunit 3 (subunit A)
MYFDYLNVLVFAGVGLVFVFANMIAGSLIRPRRKTTEGREVYECGEPTIGEAWIQFDIRYYTVALVYVIFAVEIAFLFPWALVLKEALSDTGAAAGKGIGAFALVEGIAFIVDPLRRPRLRVGEGRPRLGARLAADALRAAPAARPDHDPERRGDHGEPGSGCSGAQPAPANAGEAA